MINTDEVVYKLRTIADQLESGNRAYVHSASSNTSITGVTTIEICIHSNIGVITVEYEPQGPNFLLITKLQQQLTNCTDSELESVLKQSLEVVKIKP